MRLGIYHGVVVDKGGELGFGRLWFYYELQFEVVSERARKVDMTGLSVVGIGTNDETLTSERLTNEGDPVAFAEFVKEGIREQWDNITESILSDCDED